MGWEVGGQREVQKGGDIPVWQKPTQYCKAIILQLKMLIFKKEEWENIGAQQKIRLRSSQRSVPQRPRVHHLP